MNMAFWQSVSTSAEKADAVFLAFLALSVVMLVLITVLMVAFVIVYSRKRHPKAEEVGTHAWLEITWTLVPLVIFLALFYYGWTNFEYTRNAPRDSMVVKVLGRQWNWTFTYPNGKQTPELYAVLGKPLKLEIESADVIHGFFVPAFRLKMDAVPGKTNTTWFLPTQLGSYDIECTVICGVDHSYMLSKVHVVPEQEFKAWYFGDESAPKPGSALAAIEKLAVSHVGTPPEHPGYAALKSRNCLSCHSIDGVPMVGPTFKGSYGKQEIVLVGGQESTIAVDDAYLVKAIQEPGAEILKGYPPAMPPVPLPDEEVADIIAYLKSLK